MLEETLELDRTAGKILSHENNAETFVILTADHETGGYSASGYGDILKVKGEDFLRIKGIVLVEDMLTLHGAGPGQVNDRVFNPAAQYVEHARHSAVDVPVLASGLSSLFSGFMDNIKYLEKY